MVGLDGQFGDRILGIDAEAARGEFTARAQKRGEIIPAVDGLIAATAIRHELHAITRNTRHFAASRASIVGPWAK